MNLLIKHLCPSFVSCCYENTWFKGILRKKGFIFAHSPRLQSTTVGESNQQALEAERCSCPQTQAERGKMGACVYACSHLAHFLPSHTHQDPNTGNGFTQNICLFPILKEPRWFHTDTPTGQPDLDNSSQFETLLPGCYILWSSWNKNEPRQC